MTERNEQFVKVDVLPVPADSAERIDRHILGLKQAKDKSVKSTKPGPVMARTREQNAADGLYPEYMTDECRGCTPTGSHHTDCPRYTAEPLPYVAPLTDGQITELRRRVVEFAAMHGIDVHQASRVADGVADSYRDQDFPYDEEGHSR